MNWHMAQFRVDMLTRAFRLGLFDKAQRWYREDYSCSLCGESFVKDEVRFIYPSGFRLKGADVLFDLEVETESLCLLCLCKLELPEASKKELADVIAFANERYERDKNLYVSKRLTEKEKA